MNKSGTTRRRTQPLTALEFVDVLCIMKVFTVSKLVCNSSQRRVDLNVRRKIYETKMCNLDPRHAYGIATARFDEIQRNNLALGREVLDVELFSVYLSEWLGLSLPE